MIRLSLMSAAVALLASNAGAQVTHALGCAVTATPVVFGTFSGSTTDITGRITLICFGRGSDNPYAVALSQGLSNSFIDRQMVHSVGETLSYNLYLDPSRSIIWGNGLGETQQQIGNFNFGIVGTQTVPLTVYGRIPAQRLPVAGEYADLIVVIVTF